MSILRLRHKERRKGKQTSWSPRQHNSTAPNYFCLHKSICDGLPSLREDSYILPTRSICVSFLNLFEELETDSIELEKGILFNGHLLAGINFLSQENRTIGSITELAEWDIAIHHSSSSRSERSTFFAGQATEEMEMLEVSVIVPLPGSSVERSHLTKRAFLIHTLIAHSPFLVRRRVEFKKKTPIQN